MVLLTRTRVGEHGSNGDSVSLVSQSDEPDVEAHGCAHENTDDIENDGPWLLVTEYRVIVVIVIVTADVAINLSQSDPDSKKLKEIGDDRDNHSHPDLGGGSL